MTASCALLDHFGDWVDPRTRACPHALDELPLTAISAILSGADTWVSVALWGRAKRDWLRQCLPLANGIAAHDIFGRVFSRLDATVFKACFLRWMRTVCGAFDGLHVALDGKTVRRAKTAGQRRSVACQPSPKAWDTRWTRSKSLSNRMRSRPSRNGSTPCR